MNAQAKEPELSEYGAYVRDRLAERTGAQVADLLVELQSMLEADGLTVTREELAQYLSSTEGENTERGYEIARTILEALRLDDKESGELAVRFLCRV